MWAKMRCLFLVAFFVFGFYRTASAQLVGVGPEDTVKGFPQWYQDENGLALELCLPAEGNCLSDPVLSGNGFSETIGFGEKAYYWSATAQLTGTGAQGNLEMGLVASFSGSTDGPVPADGEQIVFFQMVVGPITGLAVGSVYRVIHPFGVIENLVADGAGTIPRQGQDIGCATASTTVPCDFTAVLGSAVGPFLQWDPAVGPAAPTGFIGNPATTHRVIGSPCGMNVFRIEGPNAGGTGSSFKETNLFKVQGKKFIGTTPIPLTIDRATYMRPLPPQIEVLASSLPGRTLDVSGTGILTTQMTPDGNGSYFARIFNPAGFPSSITVTVRGTTTSVTSDLVDIVTIRLAEFNPVTSTLTIQASSSDNTVIPPTLNALGFGNLLAGSLVVPGVTVPPAHVTLVSSAGGAATAPVSVIARPLAQNDTGLTLRSAAVVINVLGNDQSFGSGNSLDPAMVVVTTAPRKGTAVPTGTGEVTYTPNAGSFTLPVEKDTFKYTVKDIFTQESNEATVTVTVAEADVTTITRAQFTRRTKAWRITGKSKTGTARTAKAIPGNKITVYLGPDTTGSVIGMATVSAFGSWTVSKINSPVDPGAATQISVKSALGTEVSAFPITFR